MKWRLRIEMVSYYYVRNKDRELYSGDDPSEAHRVFAKARETSDPTITTFIYPIESESVKHWTSIHQRTDINKPLREPGLSHTTETSVNLSPEEAQGLVKILTGGGLLNLISTILMEANL